MSVYMVLQCIVGREAGKLFYLCTFMHSSGKINAEIVSHLQTCGVRERLWGENTVCCLCYTSSPQGLLLATTADRILS